jgi:hypothetical protein
LLYLQFSGFDCFQLTLGGPVGLYLVGLIGLQGNGSALGGNAVF